MSLPPIHVDRETFLRDHFTLPPLPAVVRKVLHAVQSGRATAAEVAGLLAADPGLVAQVLKIVNSAYYGLPSRIADVKHAVAYLGLAEIERVVLAATVLGYASPSESEEFERFWFHSFHTGLVCRTLARSHFKSLDTEGLHAAALLHDVGKLVYMKFFPEHFAELNRWRAERGVLLVEAERHHDLPSHTLFGGILCERWLLPETVRSACERHELEDLEPARRKGRPSGRTELICLANLLSNLATETLSDPTKAAIREATLGVLRCGEQQFLLLMGEIYDLRSEVETFLQEL